MPVDDREQYATILHDTLDPTQQKALWYLARQMGREELQKILWDFLTARGEVGIDNQAVKDIIDFWYTR